MMKTLKILFSIVAVCSFYLLIYLSIQDNAEGINAGSIALLFALLIFLSSIMIPTMVVKLKTPDELEVERENLIRSRQKCEETSEVLQDLMVAIAKTELREKKGMEKQWAEVDRVRKKYWENEKSIDNS